MSDSMELEVSPATTPEELKRSISSEKKSESSKASPTADEINDMGGQDHAPQDEQASHDEHTYLPAVKMYSLLGSLILVFFLVLMDMSIVTTAIPRITSDFHSLEDVGWYGAAYNLASASLQPLTGRFYSHFSNRWTFLSFFALFELGSLLCGLSTSSKMLVVSRAVAGMGSSGLTNGGLTILTAAAPMEKRPLFTGILMAFAQVGLIAGPLVGGAFTEYTTWRWCFYINLPIGGLVAITLLLIRTPDAKAEIEGEKTWASFIKKLDITGFILFASSAIMFLLALQYGGNQYAWDSSVVIGLFCGAGVTSIVFVAWNWRVGEEAMIPTYLVRQRVMWTSCLVMTFNMVLVFLASYYLPIYFQTVKGDNPLKSGVDLLPSILAQMLFAVLSGFLVGKLGYYIPWSIISSILSAVGYGLLTTFSNSTPASKWIGYQVIVGAGRGSGTQMPFVAVQANLPMSEISVAMSILVFCQTFGGAIFLTLAETILTASLRTQIPIYASGVDPEVVIAAGATAVRDVVPLKELTGVLEAYARSIDRVFYLTVGASVGIFIFAWGMKWTDVRKKKKPPVKAEKV